ncbi:hypothetical protein BDV25DRAFT_136335 [Aspergillus avenaceus]|uniref:Uncharacterized protein n=1 Tax=Aspergillus avenaceus TaxID=36643 RepID=A0A5N6U5Q0_ASPAV|nr:hypothetical protein BDV25DRAFT_136335 [Aspergillus avenaceus]
MDKISFEDLAKRMEGEDTTCGWDVLVSYDEDKIAQLLQRNPIQCLQNALQFNGESWSDDDDAMRNYIFNLQPQDSTLLLAKQGGQVTILAGLTGTYQRAQPATSPVKQFPSDHRLKLSVDLYNIEGTVEEQDGNSVFSPASSTAVSGTNYVTPVGAAVNTARGVCLCFKDADPAIEKVTLTARLDPSVEVALQDGLRKYFAATDFKHFLAGIANDTRSDDAIVLKPESFCFSVVPRDEHRGKPGTLHLWVNVKGGCNNARQQSGQTTLAFHPDGTAASAIPQGCSASVIFSHDAMANLFFKPNFSKAFDDIKVTSTKGKAGMTLTGGMKSVEVSIGRFTSNAGSNFSWYDGVYFTGNSPRTDITVQSGPVAGRKDAVHVQYTSDPQYVTWGSTNTANSMLVSGPKGNGNLTFAWGSRGTWSTEDSRNTNLLQLQFKHDAEWHITAKSKEGRTILLPCWETTANTDFVPQQYEKDIPAPQVDLKMKALDYFLTTNLLFPGRQMFRAHPVTGTDGDVKGLAIPRDFILTGDIVMD